MYDYQAIVVLANHHRNELLCELKNARLADEARRFEAEQARHSAPRANARPSVRGWFVAARDVIAAI